MLRYTITGAPQKIHLFQVDKKFTLHVKGELALEEHRGAGPAVDAQVSEARLVHYLLPLSFRTRCLEETLHRDCSGAATQTAEGQKDRSGDFQCLLNINYTHFAML